MAAAPRLGSSFTHPSAPAWPQSPGPSRPAATILRFPRPRRPAPVEADPREGIGQILKTQRPSDILAGWIVVLVIAMLGFGLF